MFEFLFDLPLLIIGPAIILVLCASAMVGLLLVRCYGLPRLRIAMADSEFSGAMVQSVMVFYGLAVALIAVSVFETHSDVSKLVSQEASELAALYRDVSSYPEPIRPLLQKELSDYADYVIHKAWPAQQRGLVARDGIEMMNRFQMTLTGFEPATEGQKILHAEALRAYNEMIEARSLRLDAVVDSGLPSVMWFVVVLGAVISLSSSFFFKIEDVRLHSILVTLLAAFMGLVIFMIFVLDHPFRGQLGLTPEPYQLVYERVMKGHP